MAASPPKPRVSAEQRRALRLLASSRHGVNAALLVHGHGFKRRVLASLNGHRHRGRQTVETCCESEQLANYRWLTPILSRQRMNMEGCR